MPWVQVIPGLGPGQAPSDFPDTRAGSGLTAEEMDRLQSQLSTSYVVHCCLITKARIQCGTVIMHYRGQQQPIMYQQASASSSAIGPASWASQSTSFLVAYRVLLLKLNTHFH